MAYSKPTLSDLINRIEKDLLSRVTSGQGILRRATLRVIARVQGAAIYLTYGFIEYMVKQLFVLTAEKEFLRLHGDTWGKSSKAPTTSQGGGVVTGIDGTLVPSGTVYQSAEGVQYETGDAVTISGGSAGVSLTAKTAGANGNQREGALLTIVSPLAGLDDIVTVSEISGGTDEEDDELLRARILQRIQKTPEIGRTEDYVQWVKETPGVTSTRVWPFPGFNGTLSMGVFFVNDLADPIFPSSGDVAAVQAHVDQKAAVEANVFVYAPVARNIGLELSVSPDNTAVFENVKQGLLAMFTGETGVGTMLYLSQIETAIGRAAGEIYHSIDAITTNGDSWPVNQSIPIGNNELPRLTSLKINGVVVI